MLASTPDTPMGRPGMHEQRYCTSDGSEFGSSCSSAATGSGSVAGAGSGAANVEGAQTSFQILPLPSPGLTEYTLDIDGQVLRYRQGAASWTPFVWPGPGTPGVKVSGVTFDGRGVGFLNEPGRFGLEKMINAARRRKLDGQVFELKWPQGDVAVAVQLRIVSNSVGGEVTPVSVAGAGGFGGGAPRAVPLPALIAGGDDAIGPATSVAAVAASPASVPGTSLVSAAPMAMAAPWGAR